MRKVGDPGLEGLLNHGKESGLYRGGQAGHEEESSSIRFACQEDCFGHSAEGALDREGKWEGSH